MTWEYLPDLDERYRIIAAYIRRRMKDKIIVDLNCLEARLLKYIPDTYKAYYANDVLDKFPHGQYPRTFFSQTEDEEYIKTLPGCDILIVSGFGMYQWEKSSVESKTIDKSTNYVIEEHKPEIVILESIRGFEKYVKNVITSRKLTAQLSIVGKNDRVHKREVYIYDG